MISMLQQFTNRIKLLIESSVADKIYPKRTLAEESDDEDMNLNQPPLKQSKKNKPDYIGSGNFGKVYHFPKRQHSYLRDSNSIKSLGNSAFNNSSQSLYSDMSRKRHVESSYLSPTYSSFKFRPTVTSTIDRDAAPKSGGIMAKQKLLKKGVDTSSVLKHKESPSRQISRITTKARAGAYRLSCTPRESFRLKDKEMYRQLLQQYTTAELNSKSLYKQPAILAKPDLIDISGDVSSATNSAIHIKKSYVDPIEASKYKLNLEMGKPFPLPQFSSVTRSGSRGRLPKQLALTGSSPKALTRSTREEGDDDDIVIVKEILPVKPKKKLSSLDLQLDSSPFYGDKILNDMHKFYSSKVKKLQDDVRFLTEVKKHNSVSERHPELEEAILNKVSKRISQLDIAYPKEVIELPEEEELPELTPDMLRVVDRAFRGGPPNQVLADKFNIQITRRDIHTLAGLNWLNDEVINFYMNMLMERSQNNKSLPSVYAFSTFFYPKLAKMGYGSVRRWTKKVDIFSHDLLLVPVHLGMHWCMATIDVKSKMISYYDSMLGNNNKCLDDLAKYLQSEKDDKKYAGNVSDFKRQLVKKIPQQMNGSDCGMFSCKFAEYISRKAEINFTQEHMPYFRRRMVYEITTQTLL